MTTKDIYYLECRCNDYEKELSNSHTHKSEGLEIHIKFCDEHRQEIEAVIDGLF